MTLNTTSRPDIPSILSDPDLDITLCAAYFGFCLSAILFGITIRQGYEYYVYTRERESKIRRSIIGIVCVLDTLNLVFSMNLLYCYIRQLLGDAAAGSRVIWSLKGLATTQVFLILLVHFYYLRQMWLFSSNSMLLRKRCRIAAQIFVITVGIFAIAVAIIFMSYLQRIDVIYGFSPGLEYIIYLAFGTVAVVDCSIASAMCVILYKCSSGIVTGIARSESVLESLIQYFVGTGLLTSLSAIMVIILYVARPHTLLYLAVEFSVTRLYANSILAMFNARHTLSERMNGTIELHMPRDLLTKEPESTGSRFGWHGQFATSPTSATRYSPAGDSSRYTPVAGSHKREASGEEKEVSRDTERYTL